ncbi:MAG: Gfo/Idh/MocA family oxidoreductase [Firmicutes bacterium]|nr:Gfo/Idh/MocA family oxidoreductase [Bacillota bacterium]
MFKIGIIGCGWIVKKAYLPVLAQMSDVKVSGIFDINFKNASNIRKQYKIYDNIDDFLCTSHDAVIIATPNNTHSYYTNLVLNSGIHVLCEKPVAFTRSAAEFSVSTAKANQKIYLPALVNRFRKDVLKFCELVSLIGEVLEVDVSWIRKSGIPRPGTWITNREKAGGGALIDIGTHVIDIGLMFISDKRIKHEHLIYVTIEDIEHKGAQWNMSNESQNISIDVETWAKGEIVFGNNVVLKFNVSWASDVSEDVTAIKVVGTNGTVSMDTLFGFSNNFMRKNIIIRHTAKDGKEETVYFPMNNTFALDAFSDLVTYFIDLIYGNRLKILQPSDGIYIVDAIERLYKSSFMRKVDI